VKARMLTAPCLFPRFAPPDGSGRRAPSPAQPHLVIGLAQLHACGCREASRSAVYGSVAQRWRLGVAAPPKVGWRGGGKGAVRLCTKP
jgi:hypothetical protein